jgi:hypothetical protein
MNEVHNEESTTMDYFKYPRYKRSDIKLLRAYVDNMTVYLQRLHPSVSIATIQEFVQADVRRSLQRPQLTMVDYPSYGNAQLATTDLLTYTETMRNNIVTPAGVLYMPPSVKESFLKKKLTKNMNARKIQKKVMLIAAAAGDLVNEQRANYLQASIKIETNSIPGAFGSMFNCLADVPNYNAVTAVSRHGIMIGYAHVEKLIAGNHYFPTLDHCLNYCVQMIRVCPPDVMTVVETYHLYHPSVTDVCDHFVTSLELYMRVHAEIRAILHRFIASLSAAERIFVYYAYSLKTLLMKNAAFFKPFLKEFFRTDIAYDAALDPKTIFDFNGDLLAMLSSRNADLIHRKPVAEAVTAFPDAVRQLIGIGRHMQDRLDSIGAIIATFLRVDCDTADAMQHKNMIRKAVIISDTDSVIFSTQAWVEWYAGGISFADPAYEINSFIVFLITMTLEQVFARLSTNFGIQGNDIFQIAMKNEFLYPLMLRTPLPKQYAGRVTIQEGFVLPKPKNDIKGLSFRSSTLCPETVKAGTDYVNWIFDAVMANGQIKAADCIDKALQHEKRVITSLEKGEYMFLTTTPIRQSHEYKDLAVSVHYYWRLWDEVFKPNFGEFIIPSKGYDIPVIGNGKAFTDARYLERVRDFDKALCDRLCRFLEQNTRNITRLIVPMSVKRIPSILRPIIDVRSIVYDNATPFIVTLRSLGLAYAGSKDQTLLSDIYL